MAAKFGRQVRVLTAGLILYGPRVRFTITRQADESSVTQGTVALYNLSDDHERQIYERGSTVEVQAGYGPTTSGFGPALDILLRATVQRVTRIRQGLARVTRIQIGDELRSISRLGGITSRSYDGEQPVRQLVRDLAADIGLPVGPLDAVPETAQLANYAASGPASVALYELLRRYKLTWYEDDGVLRINRPGAPQPDAATIDLDSDNGLVGNPAATDEGAEITMLLDPRVFLGTIINLSARALSGQFKVVGVRHEGDNWSPGSNFLTVAECRPLDAEPEDESTAGGTFNFDG